MYTEDDTIGEILLDLFEKDDFVARRRACLLVLDIVPKEEHLTDDRSKLRNLLTANLPEEDFVSEIVSFRGDRCRRMDGPEERTIPYKLLGLILSLWLTDGGPDWLYDCTGWIDQFLRDEEVDTTETHGKMLEEFGG